MTQSPTCDDGSSDLITENYMKSILQIADRLPADIARDLQEQSALRSCSSSNCTASASNSSSSDNVLPLLCPCCHSSSGSELQFLLPCYRKRGTVRYARSKQRSVMHKLSARETLALQSHKTWSNVLKTKCSVCGYTKLRLCSLPGERPIPLSTRLQDNQQQLPTPHGLLIPQLPLVKPKKKKVKNAGLLISDTLKEEIKNTMPTPSVDKRQKKKRKSGVGQCSESDSDMSVVSSNVDGTDNTSDTGGCTTQAKQPKRDSHTPSIGKVQCTPNIRAIKAVKREGNVSTPPNNSSNSKKSLKNSQAAAATKGKNSPVMPPLRVTNTTKPISALKAKNKVNAFKKALENTATAQRAGHSLNNFLNSLF